MGELLQSSSQPPSEEARKEAKVRRTRKVTDIFTWLQSLASYVAVRVTKTPRLALELMAYQFHDCEGEPRFCGIGLGKVRCSL